MRKNSAEEEKPNALLFILWYVQKVADMTFRCSIPSGRVTKFMSFLNYLLVEVCYRKSCFVPLPITECHIYWIQCLDIESKPRFTLPPGRRCAIYKRCEVVAVCLL